MPESRMIRDMMGREVEFSFPPKRIISLVPSQTEFLMDIGAPVVGRTKFCIHPEGEVKDIPIIGGTKSFRFEEIEKLQPDLIIGNKEENYEEGIIELARSFPVWMSDIYTLDDAFQMMEELGSLCDLETQAIEVTRKCKEATDKVKGSRSGSVLYLIWNKPWMAAGKNTFIDHMLTHLGYENVVKGERYPELSDDEIRNLNPNHIFFSSEPYPFKEKHLQEASKLWPEAVCQLVDGEIYSWYGSRLSRWVTQ